MNHAISKRLLAMFLAVTMIFGMLPVTGFAADDQQNTEATEEIAQQTSPVETQNGETTLAETQQGETTPVETESAETTPVETESAETTPVETESAETTPVETESAETTPVETESAETTPGETESVETVPEETEDTDSIDEMVVSAEEMALFAAMADYDTSVSGEYFNVISANTYNLAPGAVEKEIVLNSDAGDDRKVVHVFEVDTENETLEVMPGYYGIDKLNPDDLAGDSAIWKAEQLTKTVAYYEQTLGYNVVGAMNTALAYDSNAPYGYMVWNGVVLGTPEIHKGAQTYLAINYDGSSELRSMSTPLTGNEKTAISANFGWLVKDGALTSTSVERTSSDASRSMIGIKADGTLVFCQVDGRNAPTSTGLSNYEMGEMMLALGCVNAVNCDGGGSSTFVSKREGTTENVMRSIPSDGSERPTINSVILVSTAGATGIFERAVLNTEYEYIAPGASVSVSAAGVDTNGYPVDIPAEISWQVDDNTYGAVADGVFTAGTELGDVVVQMVYNGNVVGEKLLHVVNPDVFEFAAESTVIPYGKAAELDIVATYGTDNWKVCVDGQYILSLSDETAATVDGATLTATTNESIAGVDVTMTYKHDTTKTDLLKVTFGKGSEIIFDFEDGDVSGWMGFVDAKQWSIENDVNNSLVGSDPLAGQFNEQISSTTFLASESNGGQVKNGNHALAWSLDNTDAGFAGWSYNVLFYVGEQIVLRDVANGKNPTKLGMWLYIPENAPGLAFQSQLYTDTMSCKQDHFTFITKNGTVKNLNSCSEADIPESRWVYASIDLTAYDYLATPNPADTTNSRSPSIIRTYVKPVEPAVITFYIDDITLDYSSAVEDRILPTISNVSYATADTAVTLGDGAVISGNNLTFSSTVSDNAVLNASSGRILVDGISVGTSVSGKTMVSSSVTLTSGVHTVTFEIEDSLGNLARETRTFTIEGDAVITLTGHNDSGAPAEYDSVYYADLVAKDITAIDSITTTLKLQTANRWEPQGISTAEGFTASYSVNEIANTVTVKVKRTGNCPLTGEQTLVSIPIRVWSWDGVNNITDEPITPETQFATGYCPIVTIDCKVTYGSVTFVEGNNDGYLGAFGGAFSVATNLNDNVNPWHYHDAALTTLNQEPTCLKEGYAGRTYCQTCQSVISWGTTVPAAGHTYEIVDDQLICNCGDKITGSGIVSVGGKLYYLISDKLVTGWQAEGTGWCYADPTTREVATGEFTVSGLTYTAGDDGILVKGAWVTNAKGTRYSYGPAFYTRVWKTIDGAEYYFGTDSYIYTGIRRIPVNRNNLNEGYNWYDFGEDGKKVYDFADYDGIVVSEVDGMHYVKAGMSYYAGLIHIDTDNDGKEDAYYYARTSGEIVRNRSYGITKTNDLLPAASYTFGEDGKMIDPPVVEQPDEELPNGIVADANGKLWYMVDGVKTYGGLLHLDTDGDGEPDAYYYARTSGEIVCGRSYGITKTNDLLPAANYTFGEDGKMIDPPVVEQPEEPTVKNGVCADANGKLWYYVNDVKTYGGLLYLDTDGDGEPDAYYYARTSGEIVCGRSYGITKTNGLLPARSYTFGEDGKMIDPPSV